MRTTRRWHSTWQEGRFAPVSPQPCTHSPGTDVSWGAGRTCTVSAQKKIVVGAQVVGHNVDRQNVERQNVDRFFIFMHVTGISQLSISRPPTLSLAPVLMKDAKCAESNEKSIFRFLFFKLLWKFIKNWRHLSTKKTITPKIKIWNLIFLMIQPIPDISCKFDYFGKKNVYFLFWCCIPMHAKHWRMDSSGVSLIATCSD